MSPRVVAIIQARMNSSRFPGKVLTPLHGKPAILRIVERLRHSIELDDICVATTRSEHDVILRDYFHDHMIRYLAGDENDVLSRVNYVAWATMAKYIVDITADCPLVDPKEINKMVRFAIDGGYDYVSNVIDSEGRWVRHVPDGFDIQVYTIDALKFMNSYVPQGPHRSHTGWNIINYQDKFASKLKIGLFPNSYPMGVDLTLDTPEDAELLSEIFKEFENKVTFTFSDVIQLLYDKPWLCEINKSVKRKIPGEG